MADTIFDDNAGAIAGIDARWIKASLGKTILSSAQDASYSLDATDTADFFKLTVSRSSNVIIKLESQGGDANISLLGSDGTTQSNSVGSSNNNTTGLADVIISDSSIPLQPGQDYYIRVNALNPTTTINYTLTIDTLPTSRNDILWRDYNSAPLGGGVNYIWEMNNAELAAIITSPEYATPNYRIEAVADFNGDGSLDYVWRDRNSGYNCMWLMDAAGLNRIGYVEFSYVYDSNWDIAGAADFNQDGNTDILWEYLPTNQSVLWLMDDKFQRLGGGDVAIDSPNNPGTSVQSVQDFNKDGAPDIFYRDFATGNNYIRLLDNQGKFISDINFPEVVDTNWQMYGMADFNGDGELDLLWRNKVGGQNEIWFMNQAQYVSSAYPVTVLANYEIVSTLTNVIPVDLAGNLAAAAFGIGKLDQTAEYNDKVGGKDKIDYYSFTLDAASKIDITANGLALAATTNFQIETADGTLVSSVSAADGANQQKLTDITLDPGTYFVRLQSTSTTAIDYAITIGASAKLPVLPDLTGSGFDVAQSSVTLLNSTIATRTIAVSGNVLNLGKAASDTQNPLGSEFEVKFYLSQDNVFNFSDLELTFATFAPIAASGQISFNSTTNTNPAQRPYFNAPVVIPQAWSGYQQGDGTYYVLMVVDPDTTVKEVAGGTLNNVTADAIFIDV